MSFESRNAVDLILGGSIGNFGIDFEYALLKDPSKNSLTSSVNSDLEKDGQGFMLLPTYKWNDKSMLGLRFEQVTDDPWAAGYKTVSTYGAAYHYKYSAAVEFRVEHTAYNFKKIDDTSLTSSRSSVGTVVTF